MFSFNITWDDIIGTSKPEIKTKEKLKPAVVLLPFEPAAPAAPVAQAAQAAPVVLIPPFSVPLKNETGVFCFQNVGFQLLFSIDSVRQFSKKSKEEIDTINLSCNDITIKDHIQRCKDVFQNTHEVLHKMNTQYTTDKSVAVYAKNNKLKLNTIKNFETRERYTQDGVVQADAVDFLILTILEYLKQYEPIRNSICFTTYELTLCENDIKIIDNTNIINNFVFKYDTDEYKDDNNKKYDFSKNSVLQKICNNVDNLKLLDIVNPVGNTYKALMCFTNKHSIQGCIDDELSERNTEKNNDKNSKTYKYQEQLNDISNCVKTKKRSVLYIHDTQQYLIVVLKRYIINIDDHTATMNITNIKVDANIIINNNITYTKQYKFKLRGVICKSGSANGGHYVYISMENDKKILYNDRSPPVEFIGQYDMDTLGYVFLYEKYI